MKRFFTKTGIWLLAAAATIAVVLCVLYVLRRVPLDCALLAFAVCCITVEELARS